MGARFTFGPRDLVWAIVVFALAVYCRPFRFAIENARKEWRIIPDDEVRRELDWNRDQVGRVTTELQSLNNVIRQNLNAEQREIIENKMREYRKADMDHRLQSEQKNQ